MAMLFYDDGDFSDQNVQYGMANATALRQYQEMQKKKYENKLAIEQSNAGKYTDAAIAEKTFGYTREADREDATTAWNRDKERMAIEQGYNLDTLAQTQQYSLQSNDINFAQLMAMKGMDQGHAIQILEITDQLKQNGDMAAFERELQRLGLTQDHEKKILAMGHNFNKELSEINYQQLINMTGMNHDNSIAVLKLTDKLKQDGDVEAFKRSLQLVGVNQENAEKILKLTDQLNQDNATTAFQRQLELVGVNQENAEKILKLTDQLKQDGDTTAFKRSLEVLGINQENAEKILKLTSELNLAEGEVAFDQQKELVETNFNNSMKQLYGTYMVNEGAADSALARQKSLADYEAGIAENQANYLDKINDTNAEVAQKYALELAQVKASGSGDGTLNEQQKMVYAQYLAEVTGGKFIDWFNMLNGGKVTETTDANGNPMFVSDITGAPVDYGTQGPGLSSDDPLYETPEVLGGLVGSEGEEKTEASIVSQSVADLLNAATNILTGKGNKQPATPSNTGENNLGNNAGNIFTPKSNVGVMPKTAPLLGSEQNNPSSTVNQNYRPPQGVDTDITKYKQSSFDPQKVSMFESRLRAKNLPAQYHRMNLRSIVAYVKGAKFADNWNGKMNSLPPSLQKKIENIYKGLQKGRN